MGHARPRRQVGEPGAVVAEVLDGDAHQVPVGTADSEYGCACHHMPRFRKRQCRNGRRRPRACRGAAPHGDGDHAGGLFLDRVHRDLAVQAAGDRQPQRATMTRQRPAHSAVHHARASGCPTNEAPVATWCENDRKRREVGVEVHRPPRLVGHPPAREPVRAGCRRRTGVRRRRSRPGCPGRSPHSSRPSSVPSTPSWCPAGRTDRDGARHGRAGGRGGPRPEPAVPGPTRRSWPMARSSGGTRATRSTTTTIAYAARRPARRPSAVAMPPVRSSDPALSAVTASPMVRPRPIPAAAASTSTATGRGRAGRRRGGAATVGRARAGGSRQSDGGGSGARSALTGVRPGRHGGGVRRSASSPAVSEPIIRIS